jgi:hypothetical protein
VEIGRNGVEELGQYLFVALISFLIGFKIAARFDR